MIIDISSYQKINDWAKVKQTVGLEGIYIKACEGINAPDKGLKEKADAALAAGIPFGFYHFATLNNLNVEADAASEANFLYNVTKDFKTGLPLVLDIERNDIKLTPPQVLKYIQTFFSTLAGHGVADIVLYSYTPFLNANLPDTHGLGSHKLWLAAYTPKPILPRGWANIWLWQYTQKGFINGIAGNVDLSKRP